MNADLMKLKPLVVSETICISLKCNGSFERIKKYIHDFVTYQTFLNNLLPVLGQRTHFVTFQQ